MNLTNNPTRPNNAERHRLSTTLLAALLPLGVLAIAVATAWNWRAELPDPVATHWGTDGADGFSSLTGNLTTVAILGVVVIAIFWTIGTFWGASSSTRRIINATSVWLAVLFAGITVGTLGAQRGLTNARDVGTVGGTVALTLAAATVLGLITAMITPGDPTQPASARPPAPVSAPFGQCASSGAGAGGSGAADAPG